MITFKKLTFRNFLSYGNAPTIFEFDDEKISLITGANGSGKSTITEALSFALFGRAYRPMSKPSLVNNINGKNCLVTLDLMSSGKQIHIERGIKPNVFVFTVDGVKIEQLPDIKDYQKLLEKAIGFNFATFSQIILLGSVSYTPFLLMSLAERRLLIDTIFGIDKYAKMRLVAKDEMSRVNAEIDAVAYRIDSQIKMVKSQQKLIETLSASASAQLKSIDSVIDTYKTELASIDSKLNTLLQDASTYDGQYKVALDAVNKTVVDLQQKTAKILTEREQQKKIVAFMGKHDSCPHCKQGISHEHKNTLIGESSKLLEKINKVEAAVTKKMQDAVKKRTDLLKIQDAHDSCLSEIKVLQSRKTALMKSIETTKSMRSTVNTEDILAQETRLRDLQLEGQQFVQQKGDAELHKDVIKNALELLGDNGIRSVVVSQYVSYMNNRVNKLLEDMEFDAVVKFDSQFQETVSLRGRAETSYSACSQGEKQRINMAIMFVLRELASISASIKTNLLILDETLDTSLDTIALDYLTNSFEGMNVIIISHRTELQETCDVVFEVNKNPQGFSLIKKKD